MRINKNYWNTALALGCMVSLMAGCSSKDKVQPPSGKTPKQEVALKVDGVIVKTSTIHNSIVVPGSLIPLEETEIHPEVPGKIVMLAVKEGSMVSRGTLLVKLFDGDLQAQLHKLNIQLQVAQKTEERQNQLLKIGGISQQDYDLSLLNVNSIRADIAILQAGISKTNIRAPFNGKVGFKNVSIGAYVTPATVVTNIRVINQLKLEFSVPEKYQSKVSLGQYVTFSIEGSPRKYSAKVIATESSITETDRSLKVRALVENVDRFATPGAFAKVIFDMGDNNDAIMIPTQAIIPGARDKKVIVYRSGSADFQTVTTGQRDSANVQILSGVAVGDTIATDGILSLKPGAKIQIKSIKNKTR